MAFFKSKEEKAAIKEEKALSKAAAKEEKKINKAAAKEEKALKIESKIKYSGTSLQQIGKLQQGWAVDLTLDPYERKLHIANKKSGVDITIPYDRLNGFKYESETSLAQSGSTIGRAVVGGLLFGKTGAIVGGMSGKGNTKTKWYGTLTYTDKDGERQELFFADLFESKNMDFAHSEFERRINAIAAENSEEITEL